jgi:hypothetical protein
VNSSLLPLSGRIKGAVRERAARAARRLGVQRARPMPTVRVGVVETFERPWVEGWIAVPVGAPAVPVSLRVNTTDVLTTWASDPARRRVPKSDVRRFRFAVNSLWDYVGPEDRLSVVVDGARLPIARHGTYYRPQADGGRPFAELTGKLRDGHVFSRTGWLQLSKKLDTAWQRRVMTQVGRVSEFVADRFGYAPFFVYGTLLGAVREGGVIGHDSDLDLAYVSTFSSGADAARELRDIAFALIENGYRVRAHRTHLRISSEIDGDPDTHVDLFHTYFDDEGVLRFPYGVAGSTDVHKADWTGVHEIDFAGGTGMLPDCAEQLAAALYGAGWRDPQPGFNWDRDRRTRATDALLDPAWVQEVYWADFYEHTEYSTGSTFFEAVSRRPDVPPTVVDIGCGEGRDSFAFAAGGRRVFALDRSHVGIRHAEAKADKLGLADRLTLRTCDVSDADALAGALAEVRAAAGGEPILFYLRFVLHSITEQVQDTLLSVIGAAASAGDVFAAEFRTDLDEPIQKVHLNHYRRYQNGPAFGSTLEHRYGFTLLHEEQGTGLSPYRGEDPHLYRVVARRG